jgi:hypothetical protein
MELPSAKRFNKTFDALVFCIQKRLFNVCVVVILGGSTVQVDIDRLKQIYFTDQSPADLCLN